jgi:hypothetical protein
MVTRYDAQYDVHDLLVKNLPPKETKVKNSNPKKSKKTKSVKT